MWELPSPAAECDAIYHSFRKSLSNIICTTGVGDEVSCQKKSRLFSYILPTGSHGNSVQNLHSFAWTSFGLFHCSFMSYYCHREQYCQHLGSLNCTNQTWYHQSVLQWISAALWMNLLLAGCGYKENQRAPVGLQTEFGVLCCFEVSAHQVF